MERSDYRTYGFVFLITAGIFVVVFWLVNTINAHKLAEVDDLQRKITVDLLATETQFDLLKTAPCDSLVEGSALSRELNEFGQKLEFAQSNQRSDDPDVEQLKKYYSLLQVKDYLLMQEISRACGLDTDAVLYFYSADCPDCTKQGYVLTEFKKRYPKVRIYSFDTDLDFSVIDTFTGIYDFEEIYPTLVIDSKVYQSFQGIEDLEALLPEAVEAQRIDDIAVEGIDFILTLEDYEGIDGEDVTFTSNKGTNYTYDLRINSEVVKVVLNYDEETETFSVDK
ncbi:thioredoxin family protein [Patescibacteria group bacterium]|nr:thioredoxin family protein [Patescibacteria group bacterium]